MTAKTEVFLHGDNVVLKSFTVFDVDETYVGWLNDQDVVRFSNQRFIKHDRESCLRYLASFEGTDNMFLSIRRTSDERPIGTMTAYVSRHHGTVDVGIMIGDKSVWGCGLGQDAWNTLTRWLLARKDIRKLTAGALACNHGMVKVMERSGMRLEATRRAQECVNGLPEDILYYAKFQND